MGLNMPAKTVVFTQVRKWDGEGHRYMSSGEYIQMSGRAGRRGKDDKGITITIVDDQMDLDTCKEMMLGKPKPLESTFKLSYYTLLNLMSRADGQFGAEHAIQHSFLQFLHEKVGRCRPGVSVVFLFLLFFSVPFLVLSFGVCGAFLSAVSCRGEAQGCLGKKDELGGRLIGHRALFRGITSNLDLDVHPFPLFAWSAKERKV
jgi:hypothetical protein